VGAKKMFRGPAPPAPGTVVFASDPVARTDPHHHWKIASTRRAEPGHPMFFPLPVYQQNRAEEARAGRAETTVPTPNCQVSSYAAYAGLG